MVVLVVSDSCLLAVAALLCWGGEVRSGFGASALSAMPEIGTNALAYLVWAVGPVKFLTETSAQRSLEELRLAGTLTKSRECWMHRG